MQDTAYRAIAIVGTGAILPDASNVAAFWENVKQGRYCISEVSADRWDPSLYYDPDPKAPDKTYSKIGGWVREFEWDPLKWRLPLPPRVVRSMDGTQKWAVACTREALEDYGYPQRPLNVDSTAVILGNALAGEMHYFTSLRVYFPEYARELEESSAFAALPEAVRRDITRQLHARIQQLLPEITEDSMPGELANCIAGRVANVFNFHGPNFTTDAACASAMAAIMSAAEGLIENRFDVAITGGIDRNMGAPTFVKFCKIGALSATGSRPFAEGADGFVMGEGAAVFILKRLADAERDGDKIYAVLRGIGASSDGKGKGITAPNPSGQKIAIARAWENAGLPPSSVTLMEGHGTSTRVGDVVEVESMTAILQDAQLPTGSVALGSVKSNIGHLKGAAGAAGLLKTALALRDKVLPPSVKFARPNPDIDFAHSPLCVNTELRPWTVHGGGPRRAGLSAFGFGGANFHAVLEEYIPHALNGNGRHSVAVREAPPPDGADRQAATAAVSGTPDIAPVRPLEHRAAGRAPLRGALLIGAPSEAGLVDRLRAVHRDAEAGLQPALAPPAERDLRAAERIAIDYASAADLADKSARALKALAFDQAGAWKALRPQGIFRGHGPAPKVAFLYTGQGSQYVNMLRTLRDAEPIVAETFAEADRVMTPLLGRPLSEFIFVDEHDPAALARAEEHLLQTAFTQPAVMAADQALTRLLAAYGITPDMTMGHSLGEYGALVASGALSFEGALEAVSARGREMTRVAMGDAGRMAAVFAPLEEIERILLLVKGYVVIANLNSGHQAVIGGASRAVEEAIELFQNAGCNAVPLTVSHAFHTSLVAPASEPLKRTLSRLRLQAPRLPIVANVDGEFYPTGPDAVPKMLDILGRQVASPVQFVKGLQTLYLAGARVFVEVGPKKALQGFAEDVLGHHDDVLSLFTNHPKFGDIAAFNQALCGLYAAGLGAGTPSETASGEASVNAHQPPESLAQVSEFNQKQPPAPAGSPVCITGAALGLPGKGRIFEDSNIARILRGEQFIDAIPPEYRRAILDKNITRLVKSDDGGPVFEHIRSVDGVIKLAGRGGDFDLEKEFGVPAGRMPALDRSTQLAMAAGIDALRDAGIPLVMRYKTTTKGTRLQDRWQLPEAMQDDTGVIFASAFPGLDSFAQEAARYYADRSRRERLSALEELRAFDGGATGNRALVKELDLRIQDLRAEVDQGSYAFDRRFVFRVLPMGHSQFAEYIGARGPNTQVNAACASTTQAFSVAQDWIRAGRCRRVIVVSGDDITSSHLLGWMGAAFLATGGAATDAIVEEAAMPFDRRRHGLIIGMGAAALVVESAETARERGIQPICEILSAGTANSAFHGTRLDPGHISQVMEGLVAEAEARSGIPRAQLASQMVFVSHETYTPARGGSASAEIHSLRKVFGDAADRIVIANTKGVTGHAMGAGIEDVVAVKALETGCVPPVANFKEVDPELGVLNLSKGGEYPVEFALRLGAGFGSQIAMTLFRRVQCPSIKNDKGRPSPLELGYANRIADPAAWEAWLNRVAGHPSASLEVVNRTLRVKDLNGVAVVPPLAQAETLRPAAPAPEAEVSPAPATQPVPSTETALQPNGDEIAKKVLAIVSEKTGYPAEMLALDLDLEADLGVDTVKQAEMFAAVREAYNIARDPNLKLRDFPTLAHVIRFAQERSGQQAAAPAGPQPPSPVSQPPVSQAPANPQPPTPTPQPQVTAGSIQDKVLEIVAEKTGYPKEMLDLDLDLEADLGVDTVKQAEMFAAVREAYNIARDPNLKLRDFPTLAHVIRFAQERSGQQAAAPPADRQPPSPVSQHPVSQAPANPQPPTPTPQPQVTAGSIQDKVLEIVAEKTGYPKEMLDLDLDLEADLGVDTVKQAEMFAAVRETYNIARDPNLKLRDFPTLAHVIRFAQERSGQQAAAPPADSQPPSPVSQPPVSQAPANPQSPAPTPQPQVTAGSIQDKVLEIVAEKTGYPKEMLDLDLDLEADLGVDTVKQAEMFAAVREAYNIARDPNLKLRDFPTLAHVIRFAQERSGQQAGVPPAPAAPQAPSAPQTPPLRPQPLMPRPEPASFDAAMRIPRRVPVPVLRPPLTVAKPTGVTLGPGCRVSIMPDAGGVGPALTTRLRQLGVAVVPLQDALAGSPVHGVYWLPALDIEGDLLTMDPAAWREAVQVRVKSLYSTMRGLYERISAPGTFLLSATRLGGLHGYDQTGALAPLGGAVAGFTKTYKRERMDALVKVVDFEASCQPSVAAEILIEETLRDPGAVEIGRSAGLRFAIGLEERPAAGGQPGLTLGPDTVFVITGAAGSIVSAITADLAAASGGTFYLLDIAPEPRPDNPDLDRFVGARDDLKRDLFTRIQSRGERATPALVEKELAAIERACAARSAMDAVRAAGGVAHYFSLDLTAADAVSRVIDQVRQRSGRIDVLLHAAGLDRSHPLPAKEPPEFDMVFDVKATGWFNLLRAIGDMPLRATVAFSSIAARFGNPGQTDYSAANDLLCKIASNFRSTHPETRAIAIDWTAWGGIGMAARGSIPKIMEAAGIEMLPPEAGIPWIRRELTASSARGEVVVAQGLGVLLNEWDVSGGVDAGASQTRATGPMCGEVAAMGLYRPFTVETTLNPATQPFLYDHQIEGTPVLPGVMGIEAFAETALWPVPGWRIDSIEEVNFLAPFKFYRNEPRAVTTQAIFRPNGDSLVADCVVMGSRTLANQTEAQLTTHFTGRVRLSQEAPAPPSPRALPRPNGSVIQASEIYRAYFHGPAYRVIERAWYDERCIVGQMAAGLPPNHHPAERPLVAAPRLIELCFQTAGLWEMVVDCRMGLPRGIDRVRLFRAPELAEDPLYAVVTPGAAPATFDAQVLDAAGHVYLQMDGYRTVVYREGIEFAPSHSLHAGVVRQARTYGATEVQPFDAPALAGTRRS